MMIFYFLQLYVLQYPLRQRWRPYELDDRCEKVRLKPGTAEVEVEMSVQVNSENFDPDVTDKAMKKQVCLFFNFSIVVKVKSCMQQSDVFNQF